jgi:hypothetical protein
MQSACRQFFSRPGFARNEDGRAPRSNQSDNLAHSLDLSAVAD